MYEDVNFQLTIVLIFKYLCTTFLNLQYKLTCHKLMIISLHNDKRYPGKL
jgi:hypothetical protein